MIRGLPARSLVAAATAVILAATSGEARQPAESGTITIEWDPNPEPNIAGYIVHVGTASGVYHERFDVGSATHFVYTDGLAGRRYHFAVSAYLHGPLESPTSLEVSAVGGAPAASDGQSARCAATMNLTCGSTRALVAGMGPVGAFAALQDGRLLFVEAERRIRVISRGALLVRPALATFSDDTRYTALVVDPQFARTRRVYVGLIRIGHDGSREFSVGRYRELDDTLGEGAVIVSGIRLGAEGRPSFAVDALGRVYVALPGGHGRDEVYGAKILRFNDDSSASGSRGASPIFESGYERPVALRWDGSTMWSVGRDDRGAGAIRALSLDDGGRAAQPSPSVAIAVPSGVASRMSNGEIVAFDARLVRRGVADVPTIAWLDAQGRIERARLGDQPVVEHADAIAFSVDEWPQALALGVHGELYVAVRSIDGRFSVLVIGAGVDQTGKF